MCRDQEKEISFDFCSGIYGFQAVSMAVFSDEMRKEFQRRGVSVNEISMHIPVRWRKSWFGLVVGGLCRYLLYPLKVRLLRKTELIFIADSANAGIYNFLQKKVKVVIFLHGLAYQKDHSNIGVRVDFRDRLIRIASRIFKRPGLLHCNLIICNSERGKSDFLEYVDYKNPQNVIVAPLGVSKQFHRVNAGDLRCKLGIAENEKIILSVAAPDLRKNIDVLVDSLRRLDSRVKSWVWVHVGGLHPLVHNNLPECIREKSHFIDQVANTDMPAYYSMADLFVLPTQYDTFGLPPLEAAVCGCPVIVSDIAPLNENLREIAMFVDSDDAVQLEECIYRVLTDSALANQLSKNGRVIHERFSWPKTADIVLNAMSKLS